MAITKSEIVRASIQILNREGAEGLSMRGIASELHIKAASLYNHISGRRELFGEITETMCANYSAPERWDGPEDYLTQVHQAYRAMLKTVRDSVTIFENSAPTTPRKLEIIRAIAQKLLEFGVLPENLLTVSNMLNNYVLSFTADELRFSCEPPEEKDTFANLLVPAGVPLSSWGIDFDKQFLYGLRLMFAGIKATLAV